MRITIMSTKPISMNKLKSILQLKYSSGLSNRVIAKSLSISPATVSKYLKKATELGINTWPLPDEKLEEASLASKVKPKQVRKKHYPTPDWIKITEDLKLHKYLTLLIRHSAALLGINFLIDAAHAINYNTVPLLHIED